MKILFIGDIVGESGVSFVQRHLGSLRKLNGVDVCIANGENVAGGKGINRSCADRLMAAGVDVLTLGNHAFAKQEVERLFDDGYPIVRPANYPAGAPGSGFTLIPVGGCNVGVINLSGRIYMDPLDNPFRAVDGLLAKVGEEANVILVDFHAEATSEKIALARYVDGRATAVIGTHTHVQTADEQILPGGTAYLTDVGMTGPIDSILGVKPEIIINRFLNQLPEWFEVVDGPARLDGVLITADEKTGKAADIERVTIK